MKKKIKKILLAAALLIIALNLLPYCIPVSKAEAQIVSPYANSRFIAVDGVSHHLRVWEPKQGGCRQILLVHGLFESSEVWKENIDFLLSEGYRVLAVDLPGFGYGSRARGLKHQQRERARYLWKLLDALEKDVPRYAGATWTLMGHSMGGGCVAAMAMAHPERVDALILVSPALFDTVPRSARVAVSWPPLRRWVSVAFQHTSLQEAIGKKFFTAVYGNLPSAAQLRLYAQPLQIPGTAAVFPDIVRTTESMPARGLVGLPCPIYGIWGENDELTSRAKTAEAVPTMKVYTIRHAFHNPQETHKEEFHGILKTIINAQYK